LQFQKKCFEKAIVVVCLPIGFDQKRSALDAGPVWWWAHHS
jgi:hypothetical protein